jgi:hypothetical protein
MAWLIEPKKHDLPDEYVELFLCRDVYHCTPSELGEQDYVTVMNHLSCIAAENALKAARENRRGATGRKPIRRSRSRHK